MAPADNMSPPGSSSYSSDRLNVGDGTWDFTKNTFLLPNLVGLNFETMRYNGMANRFATMPDYHKLILGHGVLAAMTFLFIIPFAVLFARYYTRQPGSALRYHAYLQILAVGLTTVVFILGFFAVGPPRNLTNPHHGIGVAIYVLILLQAVGGRMVKKLAGRRSFRLHVHRWSGRMIALLGIVQVPLGLTLYGSPKYLFILFALWMSFLLLLYFVLDYRDSGRREHGGGHGYRDESSRVTSKSGGGKMKWLAPLAAGAGALALLRGRKKHKDAERGMSRSPSPSTRVSRAREPTVISSRRDSRRESDSYYDEKRPDQRKASGGGFMNKFFAAGAGLGAGALVAKMMSRGDRRNDDQYSAVATDTPSRVRRHPPPRSEFTESEYTERTEDVRRHPSRRDAESSVLPPPRPPAASDRPPRPMTPRRSHRATSTRLDSALDASDYSSYVSPSRRTPERRKSSGGGIGKGWLAGMGLGFLAGKGKEKHDQREQERLRDEEDRRREEEEQRRSGRRSSRYTGDGHPSPSRRESKRVSRPPATTVTMTETSILSGDSSIEPRGNTPYDPAPPGFRPPPPAAVPVPGAPPVPVPVPPPAQAAAPSPFPPGTASGPHSRYDVSEPALMPPMPPDPRGIFARSSDGSDMYGSPAGGPRRRQTEPVPAAAASASVLTEDDDRRRRGGGGAGSGGERSSPHEPPVSVHLRFDPDPNRKVTVRRLTDDEARHEKRSRRTATVRSDSVSSFDDGASTPTNATRRYRRDSSAQRYRARAEAAAEQRVEAQRPPTASNEGVDSELLEPLSPPNPAFARRAGGGGGGGGAAAGGKDSAYYSGGLVPGGPSGTVPGAGTTMSTLDQLVSPGGSQGTFTSGPVLTDAAAADRRRRRRLERRAESHVTGSVD